MLAPARAAVAGDEGGAERGRDPGVVGVAGAEREHESLRPKLTRCQLAPPSAVFSSSPKLPAPSRPARWRRSTWPRSRSVPETWRVQVAPPSVVASTRAALADRPAAACRRRRRSRGCRCPGASGRCQHQPVLPPPLQAWPATIAKSATATLPGGRERAAAVAEGEAYGEDAGAACRCAWAPRRCWCCRRRSPRGSSGRVGGVRENGQGRRAPAARRRADDERGRQAPVGPRPPPPPPPQAARRSESADARNGARCVVACATRVAPPSALQSCCGRS